MKAEAANAPDMSITDPFAITTKPNVPRGTLDAQLPSIEATWSIDNDTCSSKGSHKMGRVEGEPDEKASQLRTLYIVLYS